MKFSQASWQALAAIGQCRLMSLWDSLFTHLRQPIAQILITRNDIADVSGKLSQLLYTDCVQLTPCHRLAIKVPQCSEHYP